MIDLKGCKRTYTHLSKAYYGEDNLKFKEDIIDDVVITLFDQEQTLIGEFVISWKKLDRVIAPHFGAFDDSWGSFWALYDIFERMAGVSNKNITPEDFCKILEDCGFTDVTPINPPKSNFKKQDNG